MRIMLDTDVLLSVIFFPTERTRRLVRELSERQQLLLCDCAAEELEKLAAAKFPTRRVAMEQFLIALPYTLVHTEAELPRPQRLLEAAERAGADLLLTGDKALLGLRSDTVRIESPTEFDRRKRMNRRTKAAPISCVLFKAALRQPVRSLLLLLLFAAACFAFFSQVLQYGVITGATEEIGSYYRAVGTLVSAEPQTRYDLSDCLSLLEENPYVDFVDQRQFVDYTSPEVYNADVQGNTAAFSDVYICAEVRAAVVENQEEFDMEFPETVMRTFRPDRTWDDAEEYSFPYRLRVDLDRTTMILGLPEYAPLPTQTVHIYGDDPDYLTALGAALTDSGKEGNLFLRAQVSYASWRQTYSYVLRPLVDGTDYYMLDFPKGTVPDLTDPALSFLRERLSLMEENLHTSFLCTSKDMTAIPGLEDSFILAEGRLLDHEDQLDRRPVCVIRQEMASIRGLGVGDTLSIKLRNLDKTGTGSIRPELQSGSWENAESQTVELTVVGILTTTSDAWKYSSYYSMLYVPEWVVPTGWSGKSGVADAANTSFVLRDIREKDAFSQSVKEDFAQAGFSLVFVPTDWDSFHAAAEPLRQSTLRDLLLFSVILLLTLLLTVLLYRFFRRRELPILRVLGVSRRDAIFAALFPMLLLSGLGIVLGALMAWHYGMAKAEEALRGLVGNYILMPQFSFWYLAALAAGTWAMTAGLMLLLLLRGSRRPILSQLQSGERKQTGTIASETVLSMPSSGEKAIVVSADILAEQPARRAFLGLGWSLRWLWRRMVRLPGRALLTAVTALALLLGLGLIRGSIHKGQADVDALYDSIVVTGQVLQRDSSVFVGGGAFLPAKTADALEEQGNLCDTVREAGSVIACYSMPDTADEEQKIAVGQIVWAEQSPDNLIPLREDKLHISYNSTIMNDESFFLNKTGKPEAVLSESLLRELGIGTGDLVFLSWGQFGSLVSVVGSFPESMEQVGVSVLMSYDALETLYREKLSLVGQELMLRRFDFTVDPAENRHIGEFRARAETVLAESPATTPALLVLWDSELTQVAEPMERNITLLRSLYPLFQFVGVLLGTGLAALLVMQTALEAAIMRVLGVSKLRTAALLVVEQLVKLLAGAALAGLLLQLLPLPAGISEKAWLNALAYTVGGSFGALFSAISRVRKNPLQLLQTKE